MEGCAETTTINGIHTTTIFTKDDIIIAKRIITINNVMRKTERWCNSVDKLHRDNDLPADIYYTNDKITSQSWYKDGKRHRDDQPAIINYKDGKIINQWWYKDDKHHRDNDLPATVCYDDGKIIDQLWYKDGKRHREGAQPAIIIYKDGKITYQGWYKGGKLHREDDLPAEINYEDGKIRRRHWYKDGKYHREGDQPAIIYFKDDKIIDQYWYKNGKYYRDIGPVYVGKDRYTILNYWNTEQCEVDFLDYLDVPEERRLSPEFRQVMKVLPLPIGQAIARYYMEIWQFVDVDAPN